MEKLNMKSKDITRENIEKIGELFPNVITEIRDEKGNIKRAIDFELLQQELREGIVEGRRERYELTWPGKREAIAIANTSIDKTLRPVKEDSLNWENTENLYIEGDNLEALKLLQESYLNKIKCIYIDPPYNTGNDFIYRDDFTLDRNEYLERTGQIDDGGNRLFQNTEYNGRYHSDWLSMMYPRLKLARNLLSEDGVIFISIDDNEVHNLRKICDEIFGEANFIANFIWEKTQHFGRQRLNTYSNYENILCYAKSLRNSNLKRLIAERSIMELEDAPLYNASNNLKTLVFPKGSVKFNIKDGVYSHSTNDKYTLEEPVIVENGYNKNDLVLTFRSRWNQESVNAEYKRGTTFWVKSTNFAIRTIYHSEKESIASARELIFTNKNNEFVTKNRFGTPVGVNENGSSELKDIMGVTTFDYPKPTSLISYIISLIYDHRENKFDKDFYVLDFFSGSATTAHAVMELNAQDGGNRKYIMVQLPEPIAEKSEAYKAGYKNIAEIGKERIRRAARKIEEETGADIDYGFRVFKVDSSNMKDVYYRPDELEQDLIEQLETNIKENRTGLDLLIQVMLEAGLELSLPIETKEICGKEVYFVADNSLVACFNENIDKTLIKELAKTEPLKVVFRDSSFKSSSDRINLEGLFKNISPNTEIKVL